MRTAVFYIPVDLLQPLGLAFLLILASILCVPPVLRSRSTRVYIIVSFAIYASIWYLRSHSGSAVNTLMPAYASDRCPLWSGLSSAPLMARHRGISLFTTLSSACAGNCCSSDPVLAYHPGRYVPSTATRQARQQFEQQLSKLPGDIYVIEHSYDATLAGKTAHATIGAFGLILEGPPSPLRSEYIADFQRAVDSTSTADSSWTTQPTPTILDPTTGFRPTFSNNIRCACLRLVGRLQPVRPTNRRRDGSTLPCSVLDQDTTSSSHQPPQSPLGIVPMRPH